MKPKGFETIAGLSTHVAWSSLQALPIVFTFFSYIASNRRLTTPRPVYGWGRNGSGWFKHFPPPASGRYDEPKRALLDIDGFANSSNGLLDERPVLLLFWNSHSDNSTNASDEGNLFIMFLDKKVLAFWITW